MEEEKGGTEGLAWGTVLSSCTPQDHRLPSPQRALLQAEALEKARLRT